MSKKLPIPGIDYWPDEKEWLTPKPEQPPLFSQAFLFILVFACLQLGWLMQRDHDLGHFIRGEITVKPAVMLINLLSPHVHAVAFGNQIIASGGGLVIKLGCEGLEVFFILVAAIASSSLSISSMLKATLAGVIYIYLLNQARILILFYTNRTDKALFHLLHTSIAPMVMIALVGLFFHCCLKIQQSSN